MEAEERSPSLYAISTVSHLRLLLHLCLLVLHLRLPLLEVGLVKLSLTCVIEGVPRVW